MDSTISRRALAAAVPWWDCLTRGARAGAPFRLGLTPVFLDNDAEVIARLRAAFAEALGAPVDLLQRRTYNGMVEAIAAKTDAERRLAERERLVSLGRLASALAHEINNPLGGLMNAADTIRRYADRPDVVSTSAALIERGLARLRDVARAALDHQRLSADDTPLGPDDLDDLRLLVTPEAERLGQRLDWAVGVSAEALGSWPAAKVRQIALNLLLNASAAAGRDGWLALSAGAGPGGGLRLEVSDSGPGLGGEALDRLLTDRPTRPGGGLGLRVVHDLAAQLGGRIEYHRSEGATVVAVTLPATRSTEAA